MKFEQKDDLILVAFVPHPQFHQQEIALRIDGRNGPWRVDQKSSVWPWEAIDGGRGFSSLKKAKAYAAQWLAAAKAQGSLHPRGVAR